MRVGGVIMECNPYHNGHQLLFDSMRQNGVTHIVVMLSGNFVQRGEPALLPWPYRVRAVLHDGADLVLQLPVPYAISSAKQFAFGGVSSLASLGSVNECWFGSESGDMSALMSLADFCSSSDFRRMMNESRPDNISYASFRQNLVSEALGVDAAYALSKPNNILALEYLLALSDYPSIVPKTVLRKGDYHGRSAFKGCAPASYIREQISNHVDVSDVLPKSMAYELKEATVSGHCISSVLYDRVLLSQLRTLTTSDFLGVSDVDTGLANRLIPAIRSSSSLEELVDSCQCKIYTKSRIRRILLNALLGIPKDACHLMPPYLRLLGMNSKGEELLRSSKQISIPVSSSLSSFDSLPIGKAFASWESLATDFYYSCTESIQACGKEKTELFIKI